MCVCETMCPVDLNCVLRVSSGRTHCPDDIRKCSVLDCDARVAKATAQSNSLGNAFVTIDVRRLSLLRRRENGSRETQSTERVTLQITLPVATFKSSTVTAFKTNAAHIFYGFLDYPDVSLIF